MERETTEDIEIMAAITPTDTPYLKKTAFDIWKSRMPWLLILMISASFTGMIITGFQDALKKYVILTAYIPMLMDTGGNSGSQSSVTIIRGLSLHEMEFRTSSKSFGRNPRVAILCYSPQPPLISLNSCCLTGGARWRSLNITLVLPCLLQKR